MIRRPPRSTRTDTLFPYTTLFRSLGGDRLTLRLDASPEDNRLNIEGSLNAPADGLIASLAGFDRPVAATLSGKGDWEAWQGSLSARSGDGRLADIAIAARDGNFAVKGARSEERRVGREWVSTSRYRWLQDD